MLSKTWNTIKCSFLLNKEQFIGAVLLVTIFVLALMEVIWVSWGLLAIVGTIDLYLIYIKKKDTITKWIRRLTKHNIDNIIMLGLVVVCWCLKGEFVALWFTLGLLNNHLFEIDEK